MYEQMPTNDHKMMGIRYLEYAKAMTERSSVSRRKQEELPPPTKPHRIDYLAEVSRKNRSQHQQNPLTHRSQDIEISPGDYDQRLKQIQHRSDVID